MPAYFDPLERGPNGDTGEDGCDRLMLHSFHKRAHADKPAQRIEPEDKGETCAYQKCKGCSARAKWAAQETSRSHRGRSAKDHARSISRVMPRHRHTQGKDLVEGDDHSADKQ